MKKLTIAAAAVAFALPMMANAVDVTLGGAKSYVSVSSKPSSEQPKPGVNCYGFTFTGKGKATPATLPGLGAILDADATLSVGTPIIWKNDFLLNNVNTSTNATPVNQPVVPAVVLNGSVTSAKGSNFTVTWNGGAADNLKMATALISYAQAFPQFLGNATLATTQPNGKPLKAGQPYSFVIKSSKGKVTVTETALVKSSQGACTAYATIKRVYVQ